MLLLTFAFFLSFFFSFFCFSWVNRENGDGMRQKVKWNREMGIKYQRSICIWTREYVAIAYVAECAYREVPCWKCRLKLKRKKKRSIETKHIRNCLLNFSTILLEIKLLIDVHTRRHMFIFAYDEVVIMRPIWMCQKLYFCCFLLHKQFLRLAAVSFARLSTEKWSAHSTNYI